MKRSFALLLLVIFSAAWADEEPTAPPRAISPLIYDKYQSPYMGASDILTNLGLLGSGEDALLGRHKGVSDSIGAGFGRILDLLVVWGPLNSVAYVTQHSYFGVGYRGRELKVTEDIKMSYHYEIPGYFDFANTKVTYRPDTPTSDAVTTAIGGYDATSIMADQMRIKWLTAKAIDGRSGSLYMMSTLDLPIGALRSHGDEIDTPSTEVENYINYMDALYPNTPINFDNLTVKSLVNLADPFLWFSLYSQLYYVVNGRPVQLPMIPFLMGSGYLPGFELALAPYGPEFIFHNYLRTRGGSPISSYVKWGTLGGNLHWGFGIEAPYLVRTKTQTLGFKFDFFKQFQAVNDVILGEEPDYEGIERVKGFAASIIGTQSFDRAPMFGLYLQAGYKTSGYLPGESLSAGVIARGGLQLQF